MSTVPDARRSTLLLLGGVLCVLAVAGALSIDWSAPARPWLLVCLGLSLVCLAVNVACWLRLRRLRRRLAALEDEIGEPG